MKRKSNRWKTRTRGSRRQVGSRFQLKTTSMQGDKANLPTVSRKPPRPPKWIMKEYAVSIMDKDRNELANISEYAHSDKEAIAKAKNQLKIINAAIYEAVAITGKVTEKGLRLARAPKLAGAVKKGLTKATQFAGEIISETAKQVKEIEQIESLTKKKSPPLFPPSALRVHDTSED